MTPWFVDKLGYPITPETSQSDYILDLVRPSPKLRPLTPLVTWPMVASQFKRGLVVWPPSPSSLL